MSHGGLPWNCGKVSANGNEAIPGDGASIATATTAIAVSVKRPHRPECAHYCRSGAIVRFSKALIQLASRIDFGTWDPVKFSSDCYGAKQPN